MCDTRGSPAPGRLADRSRHSYLKDNIRQVIMFTRFFRRIDGYPAASGAKSPPSARAGSPAY
jgi:hypothetical protein